MVKKIYDPVHDVFQIQNRTPTSVISTPTKTVSTELLVSPVSVTKKRKYKRETNMLPATKYNRHLKKPDGIFFTRKDIQYNFLYKLLSDKRQLFSNIFKDGLSKTMVPFYSEKIVNVTDEDYDARKFIGNDKLTFSQLYVLTLASSNKGSKILREKLLLYHHVALSTCILGFLVNIGRLNTTINFYLEMTSQMRTYHSVPVLEMGNVEEPKSLQDTPRLKSILKSIPVGNNTIEMDENGEITDMQTFNVVNLIFQLLGNVKMVNDKFLPPGTDFLQMLDTNKYDVDDRCNAMLWMLYYYLEKDRQYGVESFFPEGHVTLRDNDREEDIDTEEEKKFGQEQKIKRYDFLKAHGRQVKQENEVPMTEAEEDEDEDEDDEEEDAYEELEEEARGTRDVNVLKLRIEELIQADKKKEVLPGMTQEKFLSELLSKQEISRQIRHELGIIKIFNDFEDISIASVLGVRGRKRRKFEDGTCCFETDFIMNLHGAKFFLTKMSDRDLKDEFDVNKYLNTV